MKQRNDLPPMSANPQDAPKEREPAHDDARQAEQ